MANSWFKRKRIMAITIMFIILLGMIFCTITFVLADGEDTEDTDETGATISAQGLVDMLDNVFGVDSYETYNTLKYSENGYIRAAANTMNTGRINEIYNDNLISTVSNTVKGFAYVLLFLVVFIMGVQEASRGEMTEETWLKLFVVYLAGSVFVMYSATLFNAIYSLGMTLVVNFRSLAESSFEETGDFLDGLGWLIKMVGRLLMWGCKFTIIVPCWMILYELCIRRMFAPLAVVDTVAEGVHSPGFRYLKNYFGIFIRIALCYIIVALIGIFLSTIDKTEGWFFRLISMVGIITGGAGLIGKSQSLVKEILGG